MTRGSNCDLDPDAPWRPSASLSALRLRAELLARTRAFFAARDVLEVETPVLSAAAVSEPAIESFETRYQGPGAPAGRTLYLQTSPEFHMKRLLAAGSGAIYQIARVFRQGEAGRRHNPEFSLVEWYRPGFDMEALMDEVEALVLELLRPRGPAPATRLSYRDAFLRYAGIDPLTADMHALRACAAQRGLTAVGLDGEDRDAWLDLLLTHCVEPALAPHGLVFIHDYPASQAALARLHPDAPDVAARFELYYAGIELANGFEELVDAEEQRGRFERDLALRAARGQPTGPLDEHLLAALAAGLPACAGVAVGFDRVVMAAADAEHLAQVMAFPLTRA